MIYVRIYQLISNSKLEKKMSDQYDFLFKILIIGDSAVGKSSLLLRFSDNIFNQNFLPTIGVDFKIKTIELNSNVIKMQIWDTAGQERFKTITSSYYKGTHGVLLVYDVTNKESFNNIQNWLNELEKSGKEQVPKLLIGNKTDLHSKRQVSQEQGKNLADFLGIQYLETSAKQSINVEQAFKNIASNLRTTVQKKVVKKGCTFPGTGGVKLGSVTQINQKKQWCC